MSILQIDTSLWPTSGTATEVTTRGGAASGIEGLDSDWTHGVDSEGRKYIEHANTGSDDSIDIIDAADIFGSADDRVRVQAGIMLVKNNDLSYSTVGGSQERFFDTVSGERVIMLLRHGTTFFSGGGWRFEIAEFGATATEENYPSGDGLDFDTWYEIATECNFSSSGWIRFYVDGIQVSASDADQSSVNPDRIARWKIPVVPNDDVRYRIYGDRDGYISVIDDDFEYLPRYSEEVSSPCQFRFMDLQASETASDRGFWQWSAASEVTMTPYATGGINPSRLYAAVTSTGSTASLRSNFESSLSEKRNMVLINGIKINSGGSLSVVFTTDSTELGRVIFDSGNVQIKHGAAAAQNIMTYDNSSRYCLRMNRYGGSLRVGLEDLTADFESAATIQLADISITNQGGLSTEHYEDIDLICNDCEVDGVTGLDTEFTALVSSYVGTDINALSPTQEMHNRLWNNFPKPSAYLAFPGRLQESADLSTGYAFTTLGRSGNEITDFVTYNSAALDLFTGHTLIALEWIVNDLSPVRLSEANTIVTRDQIYNSMDSLIDTCIENDIELWVGKPVPVPSGGSFDFQDYTIDAYTWLGSNVKTLLESKRNPNLLYWAEVDTTTADYFTAGVDDVHFNTAGDALYYTRFVANIMSIGTFEVIRLPVRRLSSRVYPKDTPAPSFTINNSSYQTREIDPFVDSMIEPIVKRAPVTVELSNTSSRYEIRYTTNNKNPTSKSKLYTGPIVLNRNMTGSDNTVIKARIFDKSNPNIKSRISKIIVKVF